MSHDPVNVSDDLAQRRSALSSRIAQMDRAGLSVMEQTATLIEQDVRQAPERAAIEARAQQIYAGWAHKPGFRPWVPGGNSEKQAEARQQARAEMLTAAVPSVLGAQRIVGGATITERPDLAYRDFATGGTVQAPEPGRPAELAKTGPAIR